MKYVFCFISAANRDCGLKAQVDEKPDLISIRFVCVRPTSIEIPYGASLIRYAGSAQFTAQFLVGIPAYQFPFCTEVKLSDGYVFRTLLVSSKFPVSW